MSLVPWTLVNQLPQSLGQFGKTVREDDSLPVGFGPLHKLLRRLTSQNRTAPAKYSGLVFPQGVQLIDHFCRFFLKPDCLAFHNPKLIVLDNQTIKLIVHLTVLVCTPRNLNGKANLVRLGPASLSKSIFFQPSTAYVKGLLWAGKRDLRTSNLKNYSTLPRECLS